MPDNISFPGFFYAFRMGALLPGSRLIDAPG